MTKHEKPFIKSVGGKRRSLKFLLENVPSKFNTYYEPFLGGGALFFALNPDKAVISDINKHLITSYLSVKNNPIPLIEFIREHKKNNSKEYFYKIRNELNLSSSKDIDYKASLFIFLNKTGFCGIYRENKKGMLNVGYANYKDPKIFNEENILNCSRLLKNASIYNTDYNVALSNVIENDFVYLDPPYYPVKKNSFIQYSRYNFIEKDHINLYEACIILNKNKVKFMQSNSDTPFIRDLYKDFEIKNYQYVHNLIQKKGKRLDTKDVLIKNF